MPNAIKESMLQGADNLQVQHHTSLGWSMNEFHIHESYEINLSISGGNDFFVNDQIYSVKKNDIFLFNSTDLHKTILPADTLYDRYLVFFNPQVLQGISSELTPLLHLFNERPTHFKHKRSLTQSESETLISLLDQMIFHQNQPAYGSDVRLKMLLVEVLLLLHTVYEKAFIPAKKESAHYQKIKPILNYIHLNFTKPITLDELEAHFFINKYYLCELFKKTTGFTITQYQTSKRILLAKELLLNGLSVTETAYQVGFQNDSHFIRTFKKQVGETPKQYALRKL